MNVDAGVAGVDNDDQVDTHTHIGGSERENFWIEEKLNEKI